VEYTSWMKEGRLLGMETSKVLHQRTKKKGSTLRKRVLSKRKEKREGEEGRTTAG